MTKKLIVANWKMNLNVHEASLFVHKLAKEVAVHNNVEVVLCPNVLTLQSLSLQINNRQFKLGAQNAYWRDSGAFTGEVSATMLRGLVKYVIVGHSERRHIFHEHDKEIRNKVQAVIRNRMQPILCVGETAAERAYGETTHVLHDQIISGLLNVTSEEVEDLVIAYEPVWAIGTGNNALPRDVAAAVDVIRRQVTSLYGKKAGQAVRVLYGGSVSADNAGDYLSVKGVDGLLIGGTSLNADAFASIVETAYRKGE